MIGGMRFDLDATNDALRKLAAKYPHARIVTGDGRGSEKHVAEFAQLLGMEVVKPPMYEACLGKDALICQVDSILSDTIESNAPVILISTGERVKRAEDWLKRIETVRENPRVVMRVRDEAPKKAPPRRAKKKVAA